MDTVNTLSVPIQYTFYPPLSSPLPFSSPSSPTHRYKVKIYRNLKGTKYSSQVQKKYCTVFSTGTVPFDFVKLQEWGPEAVPVDQSWCNGCGQLFTGAADKKAYKCPACRQVLQLAVVTECKGV
jgi:hypothetical protein